jgi:hypothetical protein
MANTRSFIAGPRNSDGTKPVVANDKSLDQARQSLDQARQEFLAAARQQADQFISTAAKAANGQALTPGQKIKFQVNAILVGLIFRLEPAASAAGFDCGFQAAGQEKGRGSAGRRRDRVAVAETVDGLAQWSQPLDEIADASVAGVDPGRTLAKKLAF